MEQPKIILGIESSCDETAAAVCQKCEYGVKILSNIVASSAQLQAKYGGVIPEQAAREQLKSVIPVIEEALNEACLSPQDINAIAVTQGPGLIGSLLIGVETAKSLSTTWNKPLVPVNHLVGHFYANWLVDGSKQPPAFPCLGLLVSGGHTDLVLFEDHGKMRYIGGTRDDAAGEAFDKTARLIGLPYPGGPAISQMAEQGDPNAYKLPKPMIGSKNFDFSFSGLKTAVYNLIKSLNGDGTKLLSKQEVADISASVQSTIVSILVDKTFSAAQSLEVEHIMVAGGVAANRQLTEGLQDRAKREMARVLVHVPPPKLCTDNAAYIAAAAFYNFFPKDPLTVEANPNLSLSY